MRLIFLKYKYGGDIDTIFSEANRLRDFCSWYFECKTVALNDGAGNIVDWPIVKTQKGNNDETFLGTKSYQQKQQS